MKLAIVCPCYNEEDVLQISIEKLIDLLEDLSNKSFCSPDSYLFLVDDGSYDDTWNIISIFSSKYKDKIHGMKLSLNSGHQYAIIAGLDYVKDKCDAAITIDVDLQDDLNVVPIMLNEYNKGYEIVLGVKKSRDVDSFAKKLTAKFFYKAMRIFGTNLVENHADFRLLSSKCLINLSKFPEYSVFLRGLQFLLHSNISTVEYDISERLAGSSKYSWKKMIYLAIDAITSFSVVPLRFVTILGILISISSLTGALIYFILTINGGTIPGWASTVIPIYLIGGFNILSIGIVGEYIAKIYLEAKKRPRYLIDKVI